MWLLFCHPQTGDSGFGLENDALTVFDLFVILRKIPLLGNDARWSSLSITLLSVPLLYLFRRLIHCYICIFLKYYTFSLIGKLGNWEIQKNLKNLKSSWHLLLQISLSQERKLPHNIQVIPIYPRNFSMCQGEILRLLMWQNQVKQLEKN